MDKRYRLVQQIIDEDMNSENDPTATSRKNDHIDLAFKSQVLKSSLDKRFYYEPILSGHPPSGSLSESTFAQKKMKAPIWVSSMTGGTEKARKINRNLAKACNEFGMGMGLGSCRQLLFSDEHLDDFDVRDLMPNQPLFINLGVAQIQELIHAQDLNRIKTLKEKLRADGLIIHVNPLQEAMQPEGDIFAQAPIDTIRTCLDTFDFPIIVKEVGQGMGPKSLAALLKLPILALEFAAAGGTNFAKLELLRDHKDSQRNFESIAQVGHTAEEMLVWVNQIVQQSPVACQQLIISGGIRSFLHGFYLCKNSSLPAVYGQASTLLKHAQGDYIHLQNFLKDQIRGLEIAEAFLTVKPLVEDL